MVVRNKFPLLTLTIVVLLATQVSLSLSTRNLRPELGYVPTPPKSSFLNILSLGDTQFTFRAVALMIQNSGDTFGRFSALKLYDFKKLKAWFVLQDELDSKSDIMPFMAAYYFSQTQNTKDVIYMADFIYNHSIKDVEKKWWWLMNGIYLANHKLKDPELTLKMALPLKNPKLPVMAQELLAIVYEKRGEMEQAYDIIIDIQKNKDHIDEKDLRYMQYFVEERLNRLEDYEKYLKKSGKTLLPPIDSAVPKTTDKKPLTHKPLTHKE
jgi:hypothetical protein